jgi:hypothetical protein
MNYNKLEISFIIVNDQYCLFSFAVNERFLNKSFKINLVLSISFIVLLLLHPIQLLLDGNLAHAWVVCLIFKTSKVYPLTKSTIVECKALNVNFRLD